MLFADMQAILVNPRTYVLLRQMMHLDATERPSEEDLVDSIHATAPLEASLDSPWLNDEQQHGVVYCDEILDASTAASVVCTSLAAFVAGPPQFHVAIVRSTIPGQYFAIAWQQSLTQADALQRTQRVPTPDPQPTQATAAASPAPNAHTAFLNDTLQRARGAITTT